MNVQKDMRTPAACTFIKVGNAGRFFEFYCFHFIAELRERGRDGARERGSMAAGGGRDLEGNLNPCQADGREGAIPPSLPPSPHSSHCETGWDVEKED